MSREESQRAMADRGRRDPRAATGLRLDRQARTQAPPPTDGPRRLRQMDRRHPHRCARRIRRMGQPVDSRGGRPEPPGQIRSVAVLPLENLSGDPEQQYFADGMTEQLIADLATIGGLRVIARSSVMQYRTAPKSAPDHRAGAAGRRDHRRVRASDGRSGSSRDKTDQRNHGRQSCGPRLSSVTCETSGPAS